MSLINRTYTFTDGTTAYGSQVESEIANIATTLNNLDAATSSWDIVKAVNSSTTPLIADNSSGSNNIFEARANGTAKVYVDGSGNLQIVTSAATTNTTGLLARFMAYRKPVLQYSSGTIVNMETGLTGTSGQAVIVFPDGNVRTDSTTTRINCNFAQVAALTGTAQSGLRTGSQTANTWYAVYAVKSQVNSTDIVAVADTVLPLQANYATLNTNFGTNSWVYLGLVRNGNGLSANNTLIEFYQVGNMTLFNNGFSGQNTTSFLPGFQIATSASTTSLSWTYASGTSGAVLPSNIYAVSYTASCGGLASQFYHVEDNAINGRRNILPTSASANSLLSVTLPATTNRGVQSVVTGATPVTMDIAVTGFWDGALGVGSTLL